MLYVVITHLHQVPDGEDLPFAEVALRHTLSLLQDAQIAELVEV